MFILRCTKKLLDRLPDKADKADRPASDTKLGDWTANLLFIGRQQIVLGVNNTTLLPVLLPIAPSKTLVPRFVEAVGDMLMALGIDRQQVLSEMAAMNEYFVAPTNDRRVLGTMNEFRFILELAEEMAPLPTEAMKLSDILCGAIGMRPPREVALELFAQVGSRSKQPALRLVKG